MTLVKVQAIQIVEFLFNIFDFIASRLYFHYENLQIVEKHVILNRLYTRKGYFWLGITHIYNKQLASLGLEVALCILNYRAGLLRG